MGNSIQKRVDDVKTQVQEMQMKQGDTMRSAQLAMQVAFARDQFMWGSALYGVVVLAAAGATARTGKFPGPMSVPLVLGAFGLGYIGDLAYGDKLIRVRQEAEHILEHERQYLVPISVMPARKNWTAEANLIANRQGGGPGRISDKWFSPVRR